MTRFKVGQLVRVPGTLGPIATVAQAFHGITGVITKIIPHPSEPLWTVYRLEYAYGTTQSAYQYELELVDPEVLSEEEYQEVNLAYQQILLL